MNKEKILDFKNSQIKPIFKNKLWIKSVGIKNLLKKEDMMETEEIMMIEDKIIIMIEKDLMIMIIKEMIEKEMIIKIEMK